MLVTPAAGRAHTASRTGSHTGNHKIAGTHEGSTGNELSLSLCPLSLPSVTELRREVSLVSLPSITVSL